MSKLFESIDELIGHTPLLRLNRSLRSLPVGTWRKELDPDAKSTDIQSQLYAKVEFFNPGGSVKDRIAQQIIEDAEKSGQLKPGSLIVEATSGNTGAGLALLAATKGYQAVLVIPDKMSAEKINALRAFGAKVVVAPSCAGVDDPDYYCNKAKSIVEENDGAFLANQYFNESNPLAHYKTTGPEIWDQCDGKIDFFAAGIGTGGTLSGTARFLKEKNPDIKIVAIDPVGSIYKTLIETGDLVEAQPYLVEGVGEDMIPSTMDLKIVDSVVSVNDEESFTATRMLAQKEGLLVGGSCGTAFYGIAQWLAQHEVQGGKPLKGVVLLPDSGSRYLSKVFNDEWLRTVECPSSTWNGESLGGEVEYLERSKKIDGVG